LGGEPNELRWILGASQLSCIDPRRMPGIDRREDVPVEFQR
jgi:hypothetical protein